MQFTTSDMPASDGARLSAVMARDRRADGTFVYGVTSTGVFCRPSCASRRPRPDRIAFFPGPSQAREAGFRACRRCEPDTAAESDTAQRICRFIDEHPDGDVSLAELAVRFGLSPRQLTRSFKSATGLTPKAYTGLRRVERFKHRLRSGEPVTRAIYDAGYGSSSRLYEASPKLLGMTPTAYRQGGTGAMVAFAIAPTSFGRLLVASTERGICSVKLGESDAGLERELRREFGAATLTRDDRTLLPTIRAIARHVEDGVPLGGLSTDVRGTAFTRAVWKALAAIPRGQTRTYAQIAQAIGHPRAARAVARACATNKLALVIPCHRAVPATGGAGGYRWGAARKKKLLERERSAAKA